MVMWKLKSCPRCGGDFFIDKDADGWYEQCLQCAFRRQLKPIVEPKEPMPKEKEVALAGDTRRKHHQYRGRKG